MQEFDAKGTRAGWVDFEFEYPGLDGKGEGAKGRLYLPSALRDGTQSKVPFLHNAGYELDPGAAAGWVSRGYAVSTVVGHPLNPLGRGDLLDRCMVHAVRALPFVDLERMAISGGSAGGWMTLMVAADAFPVLWANPDVPVVNWPYNGDYIERNRARAGRSGTDGKPLCPFLFAVGQIADQVKSVFAIPWTSREWLALTPLAQLDVITSPVLAVFTTADMLVPIDQVGAKWIRPVDAGKFPTGYSASIDPRVPVPGRGPRLLDNLAPGRYTVFPIPSEGNQTRIRFDGVVDGPSRRVELPVAKDRQWTIVVLDEGAPEPQVGHLKYHWSYGKDAFIRHWESVGVQPDQLTSAKLARLMQRWLGVEPQPYRYRPGGGRERPARTLDWPEAERLDVVLGLAAFAQQDERAEHLARVYRQLPEALQAFGKEFGALGALDVRARLARWESDLRGIRTP